MRQLSFRLIASSLAAFLAVDPIAASTLNGAYNQIVFSSYKNTSCFAEQAFASRAVPFHHPYGRRLTSKILRADLGANITGEKAPTLPVEEATLIGQLNQRHTKTIEVPYTNRGSGYPPPWPVRSVRQTESGQSIDTGIRLIALLGAYRLLQKAIGDVVECGFIVGSVAAETPKKESDLDLEIKVRPGHQRRFEEISNFLRDVLKSVDITLNVYVYPLGPSKRLPLTEGLNFLRRWLEEESDNRHIRRYLEKWPLVVAIGTLITLTYHTIQAPGLFLSGMTGGGLFSALFMMLAVGMVAGKAHIVSKAGGEPYEGETPGQFLSRHMERKRWTQTDLAKEAEITQASISFYVRDINLPSRESADLLADALEFDMDHFWRDIVQPYAKRTGKELVEQKKEGRPAYGPLSPTNEILIKGIPRGTSREALLTNFSLYRKIIGARIQQRRIALGWSQEKLQAKSELSQRSISFLETGTQGGMLSSFLAVAKALSVTPDSLLSPEPALDLVVGKRVLPLQQIGDSIVTIARHHPAMMRDAPEQPGLPVSSIRAAVHSLQNGDDMLFQRFYQYFVGGLELPLSGVFALPRAPVPIEKRALYLNEQEEKAREALVPRKGQPMEVKRLRARAKRLKQRDEQIYQVLWENLVMGKPLEKIAQEMSPQMTRGGAWVWKQKALAYLFRTRAVAPVITAGIGMLGFLSFHDVHTHGLFLSGVTGGGFFSALFMMLAVGMVAGKIKMENKRPAMNLERFSRILDEMLDDWAKTIRVHHRSSSSADIYRAAAIFYANVSNLLKAVHPSALIDEEEYWNSLFLVLAQKIRKEGKAVRLGIVWNESKKEVLAWLARQYDLPRQSLEEAINLLPRDSPLSRRKITPLIKQERHLWKELRASLRIAFPHQETPFASQPLQTISTENPGHRRFIEELREALESSFDILPPRQREVLERSYPFDGGWKQTDQEIADHVGIQRGQVSGYRYLAIKKLRRDPVIQALRRFLPGDRAAMDIEEYLRCLNAFVETLAWKLSSLVENQLPDRFTRRFAEALAKLSLPMLDRLANAGIVTSEEAEAIWHLNVRAIDVKGLARRLRYLEAEGLSDSSRFWTDIVNRATALLPFYRATAPAKARRSA